MSALATTGRVFYAVAIIAFGVLHLTTGDFVTRVIPWWPVWIPARTLWADAAGASLIAVGTALLANRRTVQVANLLGGFLVLSFLALGLPLAATGDVLGSGWTRAGKTLALSGGAFLIAQSSLRIPSAPSPFDRRVAHLWPLAPWFLAAFMTLCGVQHFVLVDSVQQLVPAWIPGARAWTYAAGIALIAGGMGVLVPRVARSAALLSGLMIFIWLIVLHIPRAVSAFPRSTNETTAVFEALAMSGIAWLVAAMTLGQESGRSATVQEPTRFAAALDRP